MQRILLGVIVIFSINCLFTKISAQTGKDSGIEKTKKIAFDTARRFYPEIKTEKIRIKSFTSEENFFKARFSVSRFLTLQKMKHILYVNPQAFEKNLSAQALTGIIAHELAHISYYTRKNRFQLLGLTRLISDDFTIEFERRADLTAIEKGFGAELILYRKWLYENIPPSKINVKKKNYFTPEEIEKIIRITKQKPEKFKLWQKHIPKNIDEIK